MTTPVDPDLVAQRAAALRSRLTDAGAPDLTIVAVTKTFGADAIHSAVAAGLHDIGENYAQECVAKIAEVVDTPTVHFIGHLQRNKIRKLAPVVDVWQSVDRFDVGAEISKRSPGASVMVQVDISGEETKSGCDPRETDHLVERLDDLGLDVIGLMAIGPLGSPELSRPGFRLLRSLCDRNELEECSMGMSADLEIAVDEGSTMVRVGRDLFGERSPKQPPFRPDPGMPPSG